jgi:HAE1 family hydrophobic/amphiphilic exporter-1
MMAFVGSEFFPSTDEGTFSISLEMPVGGSLAETDRALYKIEEVLEKEPVVQSVYTALGTTESGEFSTSGGVNLGVVVVQLVDKKERDESTRQIIKKLRPQLANIPAAKLVLMESSHFGEAGEAPLQIEITGSDMNKLVEISDQVKKVVEDTKGTVDVNSSWKIGKPELKILPERAELSDAGISAGQVAMELRNMIEGQVASKYREGGDEYEIKVKLAERDRQSLKQVGEYLISSPNGNIPLARLAKLEYTEGPTTIYRKNKVRLVVISSNLAGTTLGQIQSKLKPQLAKIELPPGYKINFGGQSEYMAESFQEMLKALILATILTYMLMAAILESYKNPFIIMLTLPLAFIGVSLSLLLSGKTLSMLTMMAIVMLVGIVVNNGILLLDYIGLLRREGKDLRGAILEGCPVRLRPIIMTNLAAILGMLPLALGFGAAGEMRSSMGIVSIGGLISSTIFTLYLIPIIYASFEGLRKLEGAGDMK